MVSHLVGLEVQAGGTEKRRYLVRDTEALQEWWHGATRDFELHPNRCELYQVERHGDRRISVAMTPAQLGWKGERVTKLEIRLKKVQDRRKRPIRIQKRDAANGEPPRSILPSKQGGRKRSKNAKRGRFVGETHSDASRTQCRQRKLAELRRSETDELQLVKVYLDLEMPNGEAVSYTHLTLPTICSV